MFGINLNPVNLVATAAMGPLGGIASQLISQLASSIGQQIIQQLGTQLGMPQSVIDMAQGAFAGSLGDVQGQMLNLNEAIEAFGAQTGASPSQIGDAQREMQQTINDFVSRLSEGRESREARSGGWLMAIATQLGKELDKMAGDLEDMAGQLSKDDPSMTAQFGALSQQFGMMFNATSTAIKAIGEAMSGMARKQ